MNKTSIKSQRLIEKYKFYRLCDIDFDTTLHTLKVLRRYKGLDVRYPLLRDITITYARPFSKNKGKVISNHKLKGKEFVPPKFMYLHTYLIDIRNQSFAHTDLPIRNPKVANWSTLENKWFPMSFKACDLEELDKKADVLPVLVAAIRAKLQQSITLIENTYF